MKKIINLIIAISISVWALYFFVPKTVYAAVPTTLYKQDEKEIITKGVSYEKSHRLTTEGWLDVHILHIELGDENIGIGVAQSTKEMGLKQTLTELLESNGAVAGVNGDFFGMAGNYSGGLGLSLNNGEIVSASIDNNLNGNQAASFFLGKNNIPFIDFVSTSFQFLNNGASNVNISALNKAGNKIYAMRFDRNGGTDSSYLDYRFGNLTKLVIENDRITYISKKGEIVNVPENGYLIVIGEEIYDPIAGRFAVGQSAEFKVNTSFSLGNIQTAISGGSVILKNGKIPAEQGTTVKPTYRVARTAIGINMEGNEILLMVVDATGGSIGATQVELRSLLLEYGVYNAMNLDGGGSSTMAATTVDDQGLELKNNIEELSQRKIANALAIYNNSTLGSLKKIEIKLDQTNIFKDTPVKIQVIGYDEYYNKLEIPFEDVKFTFSDNAAIWSGQNFYPYSVGEQLIIAQYNGLIAHTSVNVLDAIEIKANVDAVGLEVGESFDIVLTGVDYNGFSSTVSSGGGMFEVVPSNIGYVSYGSFTATANGTGYIKCTVGKVSTYIAIEVSTRKKSVEDFENITNQSFTYTSSPGNLSGGVSLADWKSIDGTSAIKFEYLFEKSNSTQAAYINFTKPLKIEGEPVALEMNIYSDNSGNWLRTRVKDANGASYLVTIAKEVNWNGWDKISIDLPKGMAYPITLDRIYIASLSNSELDPHTMYMFGLRGVYDLPFTPNVLPQSDAYKDIRMTDLTSLNQDISFDITIMPRVTAYSDVKPENYQAVQTAAFARFQKNSVLGIFASEANVAETAGIIKYSSMYSVESYSNVGIIQMTAKNGGLRNTDSSQWLKFEKDLINLNKDHIVIVIDNNPLTFSDEREQELFKSVLKKLTLQGKSVFVVSSTNTATWLTVEDGVRYISLGSLFLPDGTVNDRFRILRIRISGAGMYYNLEY